MGVWQSHFWQIVVRVEADNGTVGYGYGGGASRPAWSPTATSAN